MKPGDTLLNGKYTIERKLGEGGFGMVYLVRERHTERLLALKQVIHPVARESFLSEMKYLARLEDCPHVLPILTAEEDETGALIIVTPYMTAGCLSDYVRVKGALSEEEARWITKEVTMALNHAHSLNILHKDIKPENILGKENAGGDVTWYLGDWGIAAIKKGSGTVRKSGTFEYIAPEVWDGKRYPASDIYALGCTLFYMLQGEPPFTGTQSQLVKKHIMEEPKIPSGLSTQMQLLLLSLLAKDPRDRPSASELLHILEADRTIPGTKTLGALDPGAFLKPEPKEPKKRITNFIGMEFVYIPAGTFMMGSPESDDKAYDDEEPQHQVTLAKGYYLQTTQVTQGQWQAVMGDNPSNFKKGDTYPVETVSWDDCQAFIKKLNQKEGVQLYRLPSEAEWEYACRAGSTTKYCFGDNEDGLNEYAWYYDNSDGKTHPVRQKKPNGWGLYDMHGNVDEWCQDYFGDYPSGAVTDPMGPSSGSYRVLRGGSWNDDAGLCRSANRYYLSPGYRYNFLGLRVLRSYP